MKKSIVWAVVVVIVIIIGIVFLKKSSTEVPTQIPVATQPTKARCTLPIAPEDRDLCLHDKGA